MHISRIAAKEPTVLEKGTRVVGSALTLRFMPKRGDVARRASQEYTERCTALWAGPETDPRRPSSTSRRSRPRPGFCSARSTGPPRAQYLRQRAPGQWTTSARASASTASPQEPLITVGSAGFSIKSTTQAVSAPPSARANRTGASSSSTMSQMPFRTWPALVRDPQSVPPWRLTVGLQGFESERLPSRPAP